MAELLHNLSSSPPNFSNDPPATATPAPDVPILRSPVPPLILLPRGEPEHDGGMKNGPAKDTENDMEKEHAPMQVASVVKDVLASCLSDSELSPAQEASVSEPVPTPSPALPATSSEPDEAEAKVLLNPRTERALSGVGESEVQEVIIPSHRPEANQSPRTSPSTKHIYIWLCNS